MAYSLVILAAGMGSRYGGLKQLDGFGLYGETLMEYSVYDALQNGFDEVIFVIRRDIEAAFKARFGNTISRYVPIKYVFQERSATYRPDGRVFERDKPWGTTQALLAAEPVLHRPFAVINADDFYGSNAYRLFQLPKPSKQTGGAIGCMIGYPIGSVLSEHGAVSRGLCQTAPTDYLTAIVEATAVLREANGNITAAPDIIGNIDPQMSASMNFWGFEPTIFPLLATLFDEFLATYKPDSKAECYISSSVNRLIERRQLSVQVITNADADWLGVTYQADRQPVMARLLQYIQAGKYPTPLWA